LPAAASAAAAISVSFCWLHPDSAPNCKSTAAAAAATTWHGLFSV
jgi:hypothetical protein